MSIFHYQLNLLGAAGRLRVANIHQSQRSRVQILMVQFIKINYSRLLFHVYALRELHVRGSVEL
jgi:hypothetical protein